MNASECRDRVGCAGLGRVHFPFIQFAVGSTDGDLKHERIVVPRETTRNNTTRNNGAIPWRYRRARVFVELRDDIFFLSFSIYSLFFSFFAASPARVGLRYKSAELKNDKFR